MASDWGSLPRELLALVFRHLTGPYHNEEALLPASIALKLVHGALNANRHWREVAQQELELSMGCSGSEAEVAAVAALSRRCVLVGLAFRCPPPCSPPCLNGPDRDRLVSHPSLRRFFELLADKGFQQRVGPRLARLEGAPWQPGALKRCQRPSAAFQLLPLPQLRHLQLCMPQRVTKRMRMRGARDVLELRGPHWECHPHLEALELGAGYQSVYVHALPPRLRRFVVTGAYGVDVDLALLARCEEVSLCSSEICLHSPELHPGALEHELTAPYALQLAETAALAEPRPGLRLSAEFGFLCFRDVEGQMHPLQSHWDTPTETLALAVGSVALRIGFGPGGARPHWLAGPAAKMPGRLQLVAAPAQLPELCED